MELAYPLKILVYKIPDKVFNIIPEAELPIMAAVLTDDLVKSMWQLTLNLEELFTCMAYVY